MSVSPVSLQPRRPDPEMPAGWPSMSPIPEPGIRYRHDAGTEQVEDVDGIEFDLVRLDHDGDLEGVVRMPVDPGPLGVALSAAGPRVCVPLSGSSTLVRNWADRLAPAQSRFPVS